MFHEQSAVHMADAHYRVTGQPIAATTSIGPGSTNTIIGLATAYADSTSLLLLTGSVATHMRNHGVMQELDRFHSPDFPAVAAPVTKRHFEMVRAIETPFLMHRAFNAMLTGRRGPVHIEIPLDVQVEQADADIAELSRRLPVGRPRADEDAIVAAAELLLTAKRPCIVAGGGAVMSDAAGELAELVDRLGIPVVYTWNGKGALPDDHRWNAGTAGWPGTLPGNTTAANADVVLSLGCKFTDWSASSWRKGATFSFPPASLIQVDIDPNEIGKNYPAEIGIVADVKSTLADLLAAIGPAEARRALAAREGYLDDLGALKARWEEDPRPAPPPLRLADDDAAGAARTAPGAPPPRDRHRGLRSPSVLHQAGLPHLRAPNPHHLGELLADGVRRARGHRRQAGETRHSRRLHRR